MLPDRRAVVFDLDDTLYPYRHFVLSGFAAVAAHLARTSRLDRRRVLGLLARAARGPQRGRELQACLDAFNIPAGLLPVLVGIVRDHQPCFRLPLASVRALTALRADGWRLGVLTNGSRAVQARKVAALGVARYVDTVVYASQHGSGAGKPDAEPFAEVLRRLGVPARHAVFVGDDEDADIAGAAGAGLVPVRCCAWKPSDAPTRARASIDRLSSVPALARALVEEAMARHAA
jgi:putative hydrolase of the HAD superfamily